MTFSMDCEYDQFIKYWILLASYRIIYILKFALFSLHVKDMMIHVLYIKLG